MRESAYYPATGARALHTVCNERSGTQGEKDVQASFIYATYGRGCCHDLSAQAFHCSRTIVEANTSFVPNGRPTARSHDTRWQERAGRASFYSPHCTQPIQCIDQCSTDQRCGIR